MKSQAHSHRAPHLPPLHYRIMHAVMCPVMLLFGLSCRQFAELAAIRMTRALTKGESFRFRFHMSLCGLCRGLPRQLGNLRLLTRCICQEEHGAVPPGAPSVPDLSPEARIRIQQALAAEQRQK